MERLIKNHPDGKYAEVVPKEREPARLVCPSSLYIYMCEMRITEAALRPREPRCNPMLLPSGTFGGSLVRFAIFGPDEVLAKYNAKD